MARSRRQTYLIAYDIADPKRLGRVHRYVKRSGLAVQYSVFVTRMTRPQVTELSAGISERIHPRKDDVRIYALPQHCWIARFGEDPMPAGVYLTDIALAYWMTDLGETEDDLFADYHEWQDDSEEP